MAPHGERLPPRSKFCPQGGSLPPIQSASVLCFWLRRIALRPTRQPPPPAPPDPHSSPDSGHHRNSSHIAAQANGQGPRPHALAGTRSPCARRVAPYPGVCLLQRAGRVSQPRANVRGLQVSRLRKPGPQAGLHDAVRPGPWPLSLRPRLSGPGPVSLGPALRSLQVASSILLQAASSILWGGQLRGSRSSHSHSSSPRGSTILPFSSQPGQPSACTLYNPVKEEVSLSGASRWGQGP